MMMSAAQTVLPPPEHSTRMMAVSLGKGLEQDQGRRWRLPEAGDSEGSVAGPARTEGTWPPGAVQWTVTGRQSPPQMPQPPGAGVRRGALRLCMSQVPRP